MCVRWALQDSNLGASGYEPAALTAELRARRARAEANTERDGQSWPIPAKGIFLE